MPDSKNLKMLHSFMLYCVTHPRERFWQALRGWAKENINQNINFICAGYGYEYDNLDAEDTFYWEDDKLIKE